MTQPDIGLRPATRDALPCKICGSATRLFDVVDFNKSCEESKRIHFARTGVAVYYRRCTICQFIYTDAFDDWPPAMFNRFIYNDDYVRVDPDYQKSRPSGNARWLAALFMADRAWLRLLDWGGGNGTLAAHLRECGFAAAETYDPYTPYFSAPPIGRYNIVTSFETMEHMTDPLGGIGAMASLVAEQGAVLFSTLVQPDDIETQRLGWWYAAPRNGHVSLYSQPALLHAWKLHGFEVKLVWEGLYVAFRQLPGFLPEALKRVRK